MVWMRFVSPVQMVSEELLISHASFAPRNSGIFPECVMTDPGHRSASASTAATTASAARAMRRKSSVPGVSLGAW